MTRLSAHWLSLWKIELSFESPQLYHCSKFSMRWNSAHLVCCIKEGSSATMWRRKYTRLRQMTSMKTLESAVIIVDHAGGMSPSWALCKWNGHQCQRSAYLGCRFSIQQILFNCESAATRESRYTTRKVLLLQATFCLSRKEFKFIAAPEMSDVFVHLIYLLRQLGISFFLIPSGNLECLWDSTCRELGMNAHLLVLNNRCLILIVIKYT